MPKTRNTNTNTSATAATIAMAMTSQSRPLFFLGGSCRILPSETNKASKIEQVISILITDIIVGSASAVVLVR